MKDRCREGGKDGDMGLGRDMGRKKRSRWNQHIKLKINHMKNNSCLEYFGIINSHVLVVH